MSEKKCDRKNRWRNVVVAFRMSPEEAEELNVKVALSGISKQAYIMQCLLYHEVRVVGGTLVAHRVKAELMQVLTELECLDKEDLECVNLDEILNPLRNVLEIVNGKDENSE